MVEEYILQMVQVVSKIQYCPITQQVFKGVLHILTEAVTSGSLGGAINNAGVLKIENNSIITNNTIQSGAGGAISNSGTLI